jgi:hypothetical protein
MTMTMTMTMTDPDPERSGIRRSSDARTGIASRRHDVRVGYGKS